jgi:hypothetical protein
MHAHSVTADADRFAAEAARHQGVMLGFAAEAARHQEVMQGFAASAATEAARHQEVMQGFAAEAARHQEVMQGFAAEAARRTASDAEATRRHNEAMTAIDKLAERYDALNNTRVPSSAMPFTSCSAQARCASILYRG